MTKLDRAIERQGGALLTYDEAKKEHALTTSALNDAKKYVDECARAVWEIYKGGDFEQELPFVDPSAAETVDAEVDGRPAKVRRPASGGDSADAGAQDDPAGDGEATTFSGTTGEPIASETRRQVTDISEAAAKRASRGSATKKTPPAKPARKKR
jgi:hypothetical protein